MKSFKLWGVIGVVLLAVVFLLPQVTPVVAFTGQWRNLAIFAGVLSLVWAAVLVVNDRQPPSP